MVARILWADDEIDLLKPHVLFLESKGYSIKTATNGDDAIELVKNETFDLVFLDENMPGLSGLETLGFIKNLMPLLPVVMITKSDAEEIMDVAIGSKISDFLIKPVNPNQILLSIKKNLDIKRLISKETVSNYQNQFNQIRNEVMMANTFNDWTEIYKKLVYWSVEIDALNDKSLEEILRMQRSEANQEFSKYIMQNYVGWFNKNMDNRPLLSPSLIKNKVLPNKAKDQKIVFLVIDNMRYDQWRLLYPIINEYFEIKEESIYCSILPTATQYARNSIFAGLMPLEISELMPDFWVEEDEEEGKNNHEGEMLARQLSKIDSNIKSTYHKIKNTREGKKLIDNFKDLLNFDFISIVYNFIDVLSHARTDMEVIRELASDEAAYLSLTKSWFEHSDLLEIFKLIAENNLSMVVTSDHGTIQVSEPFKIVGDKSSSTNLRYKQGKNLNIKSGHAFEVSNPDSIHLPKMNLSTSYVFATKNNYMVYPNNYNYYVNHFKNTFQHGGISMEEMLIPIVSLKPR